MVGSPDREDAFTRFVADASPALGRTAWLLTGNMHAAADLVQSALVKTYLAWSKVSDASASAYARKVMVNENIDRWRARHGEVAGVDWELPTAGFEASVAERDEVRRLLDRLPAQQRRVVVLRYYEDLTEQQTADILGVSLGTVKSTAHRALAAMKEHLVAEGGVR